MKVNKIENLLKIWIIFVLPCWFFIKCLYFGWTPPGYWQVLILCVLLINSYLYLQLKRSVLHLFLIGFLAQKVDPFMEVTKGLAVVLLMLALLPLWIRKHDWLAPEVS